MSKATQHLRAFHLKQIVNQSAVMPSVASTPSAEYEILSAKAASEWSSMKTMDRDAKKKLQAQYLEQYRDFLDRYSQDRESYPNTILFYALIWAADTKQFDYAIKLADVIVDTKQRFDVGFKRDAITLCCDEIMLAQEKEFDKTQTLTPDFNAVFDRIERKQWQPDNVITTGKFYRMAGRDAREKGDFKKAHDYFCLADTINPRAGVKALMAEMLAKL
jgi:hypothetical protein